MTISNAEAIRPSDARRPERLPGTPLAHLREFRAKRMALQLRLARSHPHVAALRIGLFDALLS